MGIGKFNPFFQKAIDLFVCVSLFFCCFSVNVFAQEDEEEESFEEEEEEVTSQLCEEGIDYTLYENSDGSYTLDYYPAAIRYEDEEGKLHDLGSYGIISRCKSDVI